MDGEVLTDGGGALDAYVIGHNETAKPYRWTYEGTPIKAA